MKFFNGKAGMKENKENKVNEEILYEAKTAAETETAQGLEPEGANEMVISDIDFRKAERESHIYRLITSISVAALLGAAMIVCCIIGVKGLAEYKAKKNEITISGYSMQQIVSDRVTWSGHFEVESANYTDGYNDIDAKKETVHQFLLDQGLSEAEIEFSPTSVSNRYRSIYDNKEYVGEEEYLLLGQTVTVVSDKVDLVTAVSRSSSDLLRQGIRFQSKTPEYQYTKLEELKLNMLADAAKDAAYRAETVVTNAGSSLGDLSYAKLSSVKITPLYSEDTDFDDYGYYGYVSNDLASIEKEVTVTVSCRFIIEN